ncbi:MAG: hypothetical protein SOI38_04975 [Eggerthellaceae bacterium]|jgi:hypothetical protein
MQFHDDAVLFRVRYEGAWYLIDGLQTYPGYYEGTEVPAAVAQRADDAYVRAFDQALDSGGTFSADDIVLLVAQALNDAFDAVEFVHVDPGSFTVDPDWAPRRALHY